MAIAGTMAPVEMVSDSGRASMLLDPLRARIVRELRQPDSASGLARKFSLPRQKVNYHLRELEQRGFLELVEERRKGNCIERVLRARASSYVLDSRALGELAADPSRIRDRFSSSYLVALMGRALRDLGLLRERAARARKKLPTLSLQTEVRFASASAQSGFAAEMREQIAQLVSKYHDEASPEGRRFQVLVGAYPTITKTDEPDESPVTSP